MKSRIGKAKALRHFTMAAAVYFFCLAEIQAENIVFPSNAGEGVVNVQTKYHAKGDGHTDDTNAFRHAISDLIGLDTKMNGIVYTLYIPNGKYLISGPLEWCKWDFTNNTCPSGSWGAFLTLQGQSQAGTIIRLANGTFASGSPQAMFVTGSIGADGTGGSGFMNSFANMTLEIGPNNAKAVGIDYLANNEGHISSVTIVSDDGNGYAGISMARKYPGPCFLQYVTVQGFQYGIYVNNTQTGITLEHITVQGQKTDGIYNQNDNISIHDLTSVNSVPAVDNEGEGFFTLIDGSFSGGSSQSNAIVNGSTAQMYVRNVTESGYSHAIVNGSNYVDGPKISEWTSSPALHLHADHGSGSLKLPIKDPPDLEDWNLNDWVNIDNCHTGHDCTTEIQNAIDSGAKVVFLPIPSGDTSSHLEVSATITIGPKSSVQEIIGLGTYLSPTNSFPANSPVLKIDSRFKGNLLIKNVNFIPGGSVSIENAAPGKLVIENLRELGGYQGDAGAGEVYLEDIGADNLHGSFSFAHQTAWARQIDPEHLTDTYILNDGGTVWILGLKVEADVKEGQKGNNTTRIIKTINGGQTELLGADIVPHTDPPTEWMRPTGIGLESVDSSVSYVFASDSDSDFCDEIRETRNNKSSDYLGAYYNSNKSACGNYSNGVVIPPQDKRPRIGSFVPLYVGFPKSYNPDFGNLGNLMNFINGIKDQQ